MLYPRKKPISGPARAYKWCNIVNGQALEKAEAPIYGR